ncbi:glycosyltransferase involved in cell wall biosynthesis [Catenuloplanes nepalensis]|uniref:Glycosyltransferase involved in cell wall biosynthesis n=1 Tax=Catenuloplanes nepalensis TaxID=587533 RepID=A0ABT9N287_9ACTN|nr:glycosyltransferase [Catenuloplanes nepalensis]MDP9797817.1 glycosyltransferase involved in cell wall biosynthesis [Catenuloplanes nepalensis]
MRVVHFSDTYLPRRDGVITSIRTLTTALAEQGHPGMTIVPRHPDQVAEDGLLTLRALPCGVANLRLSPWLLRETGANATLDQIEAFRPDIVHVHTPGTIGLLGVVAARKLGIPMIHTYHTDLHAYVDAYRVPASALNAITKLYARRLGVPVRDSHLLPVTGPRAVRYARNAAARTRLVAGRAASVARRATGRRPSRVAPDRVSSRHEAINNYNRLLLGDADAVIVPTRAALNRITLPVPDERIFLVPTGVAARPTTPEAVAAFRAEHGIAETDRVLLFVGRVNREKGVDLLVESFGRIAARDPHARLVLVGAVFERRWLAALIDAAGPEAAARITVAGEQPSHVVAAAYGAAEAFVFPSLSDTQALVLQEAALAGVPAVMCDEVLHGQGPLGGAAVLARPEPEHFAGAVLDLLADPKRAREVGEAAAAQAARHTPAAYAETMCEVYSFASAAAGRLNDRGRTRR